MNDYLETERLLEEMIREGRYDDAVDHINRMMREYTDRKMLALLLYELGKARYFMGDHAGAIESVKEAHSLIDDMDDCEFKYAMLFHIAALYSLTGDMDNAERMYLKVMDNLPEGNHFHLSAMHNLGEMRKKTGDVDNAMRILEDCHHKAIKYGDNFIAAYSAENLAEMHAMRGDREGTVSWLEKALSLARKAGDNRLVPMIELTLRMLRGEDAERIMNRADEIKNMGADHAHDMADMFYIFSRLLPKELQRIYLERAVILYGETGDGYMRNRSIERLEQMR